MRKDAPLKEEVWIRVAVAYVQSSNSTSKDYATTWADYIADKYAERFLNKSDD